jgi:hypothetical protein
VRRRHRLEAHGATLVASLANCGKRRLALKIECLPRLKRSIKNRWSRSFCTITYQAMATPEAINEERRGA